MLALLIPVLLLALPVVIRPVAVVPAGTTAESEPLIIFGTVYDAGGIPVEGADVTVTVMGSYAAPQDTVSITGGFYTVSFFPTDWTTGNTVKVVSSFGGESGENQTTADSANLQIDVHLVAAIPEFPSILPVVGATAVMVAIISGCRRLEPRIDPQMRPGECPCHLEHTEE